MLVRLLPAVVAGVFLGESLSAYSGLRWLIVLVFVCSFALLMWHYCYFAKAKIYRLRYTSFIPAALLTFSFFCAWTFFSAPSNDPRNFERKSFDALLLKLKTEAYSAEKSWRFEAEALAYLYKGKFYKCGGNVLIYINKRKEDSFISGDQLLVSSAPVKLKAPMNPGEFDQAFYYRCRGITQRIYADSVHYRLVAHSKQPFLRSFRSFCQQRLEERLGEGAERTLIPALLFGLRGSLDKDLKELYQSTGLSHVLSVSGMHVSLLMLICARLMFYLNRGRRSKVIRSVILMIVVAFYALLTGMDAPVFRAGLMIILALTAGILRRDLSMLNLLAVSLIVQALLDPLSLMNVGLQLSYSAMYGLIVFFPVLSARCKIKNRVLKVVSDLILVSLSAQMATLPFLLFYFSSFPTYFLLANLIISLPVFLMMCLGILLLFCPYGLFSAFIAKLLGIIVTISHNLLAYIQNWPLANISFSKEIFIFYPVLGLCCYYCFSLLHRYSWSKFRAFISLCSLLLFISTLSHVRNVGRKQLSFLYEPGAFVLHLQSPRRNLLLFKNTSGRALRVLKARGFRGVPCIDLSDTARPFSSSDLYVFGGLIQYQQIRIMLVDRTFPELRHFSTEHDIDLLVLSGGPDVRLSSLRSAVRFKQVIIASDNFREQALRWRAEAALLDVPFHDIRQEGAIVFKVGNKELEKIAFR